MMAKDWPTKAAELGFVVLKKMICYQSNDKAYIEYIRSFLFNSHNEIVARVDSKLGVYISSQYS
jgi:hypothetical protein